MRRASRTPSRSRGLIVSWKETPAGLRRAQRRDFRPWFMSTCRSQAWQSAARFSARGVSTAQRQAEHLLFYSGIVVLAVIVTVSLAAMIGVAVPVRRLIKATRKLAGGGAGTLGGRVRELDEVAAGARTHMAEQLSVFRAHPYATVSG